MELTIQQGELAFAAGRALGSVSTKSPLPLLSCVLVEAEPAGLRVTGTDLDLTTSVFVPCKVKTPGKVAVSARLFNDVVRKLLAIPDPWYTAAAIPIGYPVGRGHGPLIRRPVEQLAYLDTWGKQI